MQKNMKRLAAVTLLILGCFHAEAHAALAGGAQNIPAVMVRGLGSIVCVPLELVRTPMAEAKEHSRLWPFTSAPRIFRNASYRLASGVYDAAFYPFAMPFIDEAPPLTERMGIANSILSAEDDF